MLQDYFGIETEIWKEICVHFLKQEGVAGRCAASWLPKGTNLLCSVWDYQMPTGQKTFDFLDVRKCGNGGGGSLASL